MPARRAERGAAGPCLGGGGERGGGGGGGEGGGRGTLGGPAASKGKGEVGREREGREALALRAFQRVKYSYQGFI